MVFSVSCLGKAKRAGATGCVKVQEVHALQGPAEES